MKRIGLLGGIIIISIMLLMLIVIQFVWMKGAASADKRETDLHIHRALERVESSMLMLEVCYEAYSKVYMNTGERFYMIKEVNGGRKADTVDMYYNTEGFYPDEEVYSDRSVDYDYPVTIDVKVKFRLGSFDTAKYNLERNAFAKRERKKFRDYVSNPLPIADVINMHKMDSVIRVNLDNEHVKGTYGFAFIQDKTNNIEYAERISDTLALLKSPYTVSLFADNKNMKPYKLALLFPASKSIYAINFWLLLSIAIVILVTISFYYFVRLYMKQTRLSEMKSDFINNLTHEFNTPMANISLAIETLEENGGVSHPKTRNIFDIISKESQRLRDNIDRALQIARMEKGNLFLQKEQLDMEAMIQTVLPTYQLQCEQLGGDVSFSATGNANVYGDETHLLNCVCNILDNAIKYRKKEPFISISLKEQGTHVLLEISDNGIGMSSETQKHIFEKFYRAHDGDIHNTKGFGLGLNYVKGIIEAHGGKISVWSRLSEGSRFTIILPKAINYGK